MIWYYIFMGVTLLFIGFLIHRFKAYFLISGYNMYSDERKEKVDIKALGKLFGVFGYSNGVIFLGCALLEGLGYSIPMWPSTVYLIVSIVFLLILSQKYDHSTRDDEGKLTSKSKKERNMTIGILGVTVVFVGAIFFFSLSTPKIILNDAGIEIKGLYGDFYSWNSISTVELKNELPEITLRTNGSSLAGRLKGRFKTKEDGNVTLFVNKIIPSYIYVNYQDKLIIFNLSSEEETLMLFQELESLR